MLCVALVFVPFIGIFSKIGAIIPWLYSTELFGTPSANQHQEICTGKEHMKTVQILLYPFVYDLPVPEVSLDNQKYMFNLAPDRRLSVLNMLIQLKPLYASVVFKLLGRLAICRVMDFRCSSSDAAIR